MVFGEIVEPSTRALIDDEFEDYPEYVEPTFLWEGSFHAPSIIDKLIFIESDKIIKLFKSFVIREQNLCALLKNGGVTIYQLPKNVYIASYSPKELTTGQIVEAMREWIEKSRNIYAVTSASLATYQSFEVDKPETVIRVLSSSPQFSLGLDKLESPNLLSGLGASVLTYCLHRDLQCGLFVVYLSNTPLDSRNTEPIIQLMKSLKVEIQPQNSNLNPFPSNLYL